MPEFQIPLLLSSDPINGATEISQNGSRFTVIFTRPLLVPKEARYCYITVEQVNVIFNTPNIFTGVNDKMRVEFDDGVIQAQYDLTINQGLWDLNHLNSAIQQQLSNTGALPDAITLLPDTATQKVIVKYREDYQIDWTITQTFRDIVGFNSRIAPIGGYATQDDFYEPADNVAKFNTTLYYLIHTDLVSGRGLRINGNYADIVAQVPIDVEAGSLINYQPRNPQMLPCPNLIGQSLREIHVWLTDDKNQFVDTVDEVWSIQLTVHYVVD